MPRQFQELIGVDVEMIGQQDAGLDSRTLLYAQNAPYRLMIQAGSQCGFAITLIVFNQQLFDAGLEGLRIVAFL
jgi:hypothetical protein